MGLVTAIFCFIIGIPMFLGGLGLTVWGAQDLQKVNLQIGGRQLTKMSKERKKKTCIKRHHTGSK